MNTTYSHRTLHAVRRERELVELSIVLYRRLRTGTGRECAEQFTHQKNRETIANIKGLVSAYAALEDATEMPSEFFTTKILLRISITAVTRQIIKSINTRNTDGLDITGPRSPECRNQVLAVVIWLANPKHLQSSRGPAPVEFPLSSAEVML